MVRVPAQPLSPLELAVVRGWARHRPAALVLGNVNMAAAAADLVSITTIESVVPKQLSDVLRQLPSGALIVNAGSSRVAAMRAILRNAEVPVTVLWHRFAVRFGDHAIERHLVPSRLVDRWAVFEVPGSRVS